MLFDQIKFTVNIMEAKQSFIRSIRRVEADQKSNAIALAVFDAVTSIDPSGADFEDNLPDMALTTEFDSRIIDHSRYKDIFDKPTS